MPPRFQRSPVRASLLAAWIGLFVAVASVLGADPTVSEIVESTGAFGKLKIGAASGLKQGDVGVMIPVGGLGENVPVVVTSVKPDYVVVQSKGSEPLIGQMVRFEKTGQAGPVIGNPFWRPSEAAATSSSSAPAAASPFWKPGEVPPDVLEAPEATFEGLRGKTLDLEYRTGQKLRGVTIDSIQAEQGQVLRLHVHDPQGKRIVDVDLEEVGKVWVGYDLAWTNNLKAEVKSRSKTSRERTIAQMEERAKKRDRAFSAIVAETQQELWPELSPAELEEIIDKERKFGVEEVTKRFTNLRLFESEHFLFFTTMAPNEVGKYVLKLDQMHDMLVKLYQLSPSKPVFKGKALVFAFETQREFILFEAEFMSVPIEPGVLGLCHMHPDGRVLLSCFRNDDPLEFEHVIVHEMSHGFMHRYKAGVHVPSWIDEGLAEYVAKTLVPKFDRVDISSKYAVQMCRVTRRLGDQFFHEEAPIDADEYGLAVCVVDFLLKEDEERFVELIEGMKGGLKPEEALLRSYETDYLGLTQAYGRSIGVPRLMP